MSVDLQRNAPARRVDAIDADGVAPGDVEVLSIEGVVWGYGYACAGCGARSYLALGAENPGPRWDVTAGDAREPSTVTLSPSILHAPALGGCGWHGYLRAGAFVPC